MADNTTLNGGSGGDTIRDLDKGGVKTPVVTLDLGGAGAESLIDGAMPVTGTFWQATQPVSGTVTADQGGDWTVSIAGTVAVASVGGNVEITNDVGNPIPVSGTVTANIGTTNGLALDATLTGGTQRTKLVDAGGANVAAVSAAGAVKVDGSAATQPVSGSVSPSAATSGGATPYHLISAASTNAASVKASAGVLYSASAFNTNAAARYLKLYDKASSPTVGADTPVATYLIPPSSGGFTLSLPVGLQFSSGIALAITGAMGDSDTTAVGAGDVCLNLAYK